MAREDDLWVVAMRFFWAALIVAVLGILLIVALTSR
jgi:hypothetical protein